jgi:hypothetical protein
MAHFEWKRGDGYEVSFETPAIAQRIFSLGCVSAESRKLFQDSSRAIFIAFVGVTVSRLCERALAALFLRENVDQRSGDGSGTTLARQLLVDLANSTNLEKPLREMAENHAAARRRVAPES